ncbi:TM2 domain-containing membrane protein YozV [Planifilum fulgidum]|jgi:TM2 domain-containing membrane protein YozV|uniref:TM2 domain-containing membrane protein YozV n=1 Tax=Planifilum fulgidum TaxID=201973 RepID=A0A1I2MVP6_9BACL|nr:TM2 domain-containing protein [Planifilum fulgidum]SFF95645.1 TM2 domain-containing membrane protein YozV [Planifilum fulgidum]
MSNLALKQQLNQHQLSMVQSEMEHKMKSMAVAYLLAIFLGYFGAHRFYVRKTGTAVTQLVLFLLGVVTAIFLVGFVFLFIVGFWVLIDLFLLHGQVNRLNEEIEREIIEQVLRQSA